MWALYFDMVVRGGGEPTRTLSPPFGGYLYSQNLAPGAFFSSLNGELAHEWRPRTRLMDVAIP